MGEEEAGAELRELSPGAPQVFALGGWFHGKDRAWQHTSHAFGFIAPTMPREDTLDIHHAGNIEADEAHMNANLKVTLDGLRAANYPGKGTHRVLFDIYAQNQIKQRTEHMHFNSSYRIQEGE